MKDSLLLPVQSNGGTRHSANQGPNRGEVLTGNALIGGNNALPENKDSKYFLETFNKALQLSDDEMSALASGASSTQELETENQPNGRTNLFTATNQPMSEHISLATSIVNAPVELRVDATTPLALAQFTNSEVEAISFPKDIAKNDISQSDLSIKYAELRNVDDLNFDAPLFRETPINANASITDTGDTLPITGEAGVHILRVDRPQAGAIDTAIEKNETSLPNIKIQNTPLPEQIQLISHQSFETIKGQSFPAFSLPAPSTEGGDMVDNDVKNSDNLRPLSDILPERTTEQTGVVVQNAASTSPVDIQMSGELWAELETISLENPDRHIEIAEATNPTSIFLPAQTIEEGTDLLPLPLIREPLENPRQPGNIHNFRGVLTQGDVEQIMLGRSTPDQDLATSSETSEADVDYIKTTADNIIGASRSDTDSAFNNTADNIAPPNTGTSRAEVDYSKTTADNTVTANSNDPDILENVQPHADTGLQIEGRTELLPLPLMREPLVDAKQPGNIHNFRGALTQDDVEQIMLGRSSTDQNLPSEPSYQAPSLSPETSEADVDYIKTTADNIIGASRGDIDSAFNNTADNISPPNTQRSRAEVDYSKTTADNTVTANSNDPDILENVQPHADTTTQNAQSEFEDGNLNAIKATVHLPPPTLESASIPIAPNDNKLEIEAETDTKTEVKIASTAQQNTAIDNTGRDIFETASFQREAFTQEGAAALPLPTNTQTIDITAATSGDTLIQTMPNGETLPVGIGAPLTTADRAVNENNRGTVSLSDFQLGASHQTDLNTSELYQKATPKDTREIEADVEREDLSSSADIRDVELQPDEIDISDLMSEAAEADFETAKNFPSLGQTALSPLAMSTASSPVLQPLMGLGAEMLSPLALQSQNAAASSSTFSQSPAVREAVVSTVSDALLTAKETPKGVVVQLDPPEMGRVYIDFLFEGDNNVSVVVKSESAESQAILRERQEYFQSLLKESGFNNVTLSFEQQAGNGEGSSESGEQGKDINIALSGQSVEAQTEPYNQRIYQVSEDAIRLDMRL